MIRPNIPFLEIQKIREEAQKAAEEVLKACCRDQEAGPFDPFTIAEQMGLQVKGISVQSKVAGGLLREQGRPPTIFFNDSDVRNRLRFTVAHELGHYYRHFTEQGDVEYMDYRNEMSSTASDPEEVFANQFAANLLMPEKLVRTEFKKLQDLESDQAKVVHLAKGFQVSVDAMTYRLKSLELVK